MNHEDRRAEAVALVESGSSYSEAAAFVGVSHVSVRTWYSEVHGYRRRQKRYKHTDEDRARAVELYKMGKSAYEIADILNKPYAAAIYKWIKDAGVPIRSRAEAGGSRRRYPPVRELIPLIDSLTDALCEAVKCIQCQSCPMSKKCQEVQLGYSGLCKSPEELVEFFKTKSKHKKTRSPGSIEIEGGSKWLTASAKKSE